MKVGDLVKLSDPYVISIRPTAGIGVIVGVGMDHHGEETLEVYWFNSEKKSLMSRSAVKPL